MDAIRLIRISFDNLENQLREARIEKIVATFVTGDGLSPQGKVEEFLRKLPPVQLYLGWDGNVYPRYILEKCKVE